MTERKSRRKKPRSPAWEKKVYVVESRVSYSTKQWIEATAAAAGLTVSAMICDLLELTRKRYSNNRYHRKRKVAEGFGVSDRSKRAALRSQPKYLPENRPNV